MKFGIFYEHQMPRPWPDPDAERRHFHNALDQAELADRLGFDYFWEVEHHFLEEYSHSSAPEVFLAAVSQRTRNIRIGHGVVQTPPAYNHPARVAERIATLDLVSNGRVEFGTGESSADMELGGFGVPRDEKRAMWEEGLRVALRCLVEEPFTGHEGRYVSMPPRNVVPKPSQRPHPPVWVACSRRETIALAARRGIGALSFAFVGPDEARKWVDDYYRLLETECDPIAYTINPQVAIVTGFMCCGDEREAIDKGLDGAQFFAYALGHYYAFGRHVPGETDIWADFQRNREGMGLSRGAITGPGGTPGETARSNGLSGAVGTPDQVRQYLRGMEEAGVDQVIFVAQAGANRHEDICEAYELFAREVMPEFKERDERLERDKRRRLAPVIDRIMAARSDRRPAPDSA
jgi:alkanesulfonate monooxygenase SsuD/methylene tetrahydromethanopterin reductase-like flavin-dependent oxidoreductase (luciferase family)